MAKKSSYYKGMKIGSKEYWTYQYGTYLTKRIEVQQQGYELKAKLTKSEFKQVYNQAKKVGVKNIIRTMASEDKLINFDLAKKIFEKETGKTFSYLTKNVGDKEFFKKIISMDFITEKHRKETLDYFQKKYGREYSGNNFNEYVFFKYMADIGQKEIAEEYYGY